MGWFSKLAADVYVDKAMFRIGGTLVLINLLVKNFPKLLGTSVDATSKFGGRGVAGREVS